MKLDFDLDFFYYQPQIPLDGVDSRNEANVFERVKFVAFAKTLSLEETLEILTFIYSENFADYRPWFSCFRDSSKDFDEKMPEYLDPQIDIFLGNGEQRHSEMDYVIFKNYVPEQGHPPKLDWIEIGFSRNQNLDKMSTVISRGLEKVEYEKKVDNDKYVFTPKSESAISDISISETTFRMTINPDKWIYF